MFLPPLNSIALNTIESRSSHVPPGRVSCPIPPPLIPHGLVGCCVLIHCLAATHKVTTRFFFFLLNLVDQLDGQSNAIVFHCTFGHIQSPLRCLPYCRHQLSVDCWVSWPNSSHLQVAPRPSLYLFVAPFANRNNKKALFLPSCV